MDKWQPELDFNVDEIQHFTESEQPLLLIIGEAHTGKTNLIENAINKLRLIRHVIHLHGKTDITPNQICELLAKHWMQNTLNESDRLETKLQHILNDVHANHHECTLIIDNADQLSLATLAAIAHLAIQQDTKHIFLHIILVGEPSLREKISDLITKEVPQITLGSINFLEAKKIMQTYLDKMHIKANNKNSQGVFERIYHKSFGMPQTMLNLLKNVTAENLVGNKTHQSIKQQLSHIISNTDQKNFVRIAALVGLACVGTFLFWHKHQQLHSHPLPPTEPVEFAVKPLQRFHVLSNLDTKNAAQHIQQPIKPQDEINKHNVVKPMTHLAHKTSATPHTKIKFTKSNAPQYTLQLMSSNNKAALQKYVEKHHLAASTEIFKTTYKHQHWYYVGYGHFSHYSDAKQKLNTLPAQLAHMHPWIRTTRK